LSEPISERPRAIGIFDSGIGGLTVLKALKEALPEESFIYLGDTARLPYGTKSPETIRRYLQQNMAFMERRGVKALVVACNTASSVLAEVAAQRFPVFGVVEPGANAANRASRNRRIGVLGTNATVSSNAYAKVLHRLDAALEVTQTACPLLVPLVEEGWEDDPITREIVKRYLEAPLDAGVDTLILGCTHYPVLKRVIQELVGPQVTLVDSAQEIARRLQTDLREGRIASGNHGELRVLTTDISPSFKQLGSRILAPYRADTWHWADIGENEEL